MDYKDETRKAYDKLATEYAKKFKEYSDQFLNEELQSFIDLIPQGGRVLDLGSGPGVHAEVFKNAGINVMCLDISEEMVKVCRSKGLETVVGDFEDMDLPDNSFDGVWAYTSLLHTTRAKFPLILSKIKSILKDGGIFGLAMKEGSGEDFKPSGKGDISYRWFSLYTNDELQKYLKDLKLEILFSSRSVVRDDQIFLNYLCRKHK